MTFNSGCSLQQDIGSRPDAPGQGAAAPPISGTTLDGVRIDSASLRGHPVVLDFWASWCGPCRLEQPDINALHAQYAAKGVTFLGIDMRDDDAAAAAYKKEFSVPYASIPDASQQIAAAYDVASPPEVIVVDGSSHIVQRFLGTIVGVKRALDSVLTAGGRSAA